MNRASSPLRIAALLGLLLHAGAIPASSQATEPDSLEYGRLVAALRSGSRDVDFTRLRMAYAASPDYDPYDTDIELPRRMHAALQARSFEQALVLADSVLERNYLDVTAHYVAWMAARQTGRMDRAPYHAWVARGLTESIGASGGRSRETPMVVIEISEEYAYLQAHGLEPTGRSLTKCGENDCDAVEVRNPRTGERITLYFDISIPKRWFMRSRGRP